MTRPLPHPHLYGEGLETAIGRIGRFLSGYRQ